LNFFVTSFQPRWKMSGRLRAFLRDDSGATSIEYALIAAGIALVIITVVKGVGTKLNTTFASVSTQLK
jgi:pilus assembly protein Flp/PilA